MEIKIFDGISKLALDVRITVFVEEQGFVDEIDDIDKTATHIVVVKNGKSIATCRIFKKENGTDYILGRLAVLKEYRNKGVGSILLKYAEDTARLKGAKVLFLHSQIRAKEFYLKNGYMEFGEIEYEENYPHIWMKKKLN